jgi:hypothetical protein
MAPFGTCGVCLMMFYRLHQSERNEETTIMAVPPTNQLKLFEPPTGLPMRPPPLTAEMIAAVAPLLQVLLQEIAAAEAGMVPAAEPDEPTP